MGDRGWLSGAAMHSEYHTIERKKAKAADCIYQTKNRICRNENSPCYTVKCFEATWCTYRKKSKDVSKPQKMSALIFDNVKEINLKQISIPDYMNHPHYNKGASKVEKYYKKNDEFPFPVYAQIRDNKYCLVSNYLIYYVAKTMGLETVPVRLGTISDKKYAKEISEVGKHFMHEKFGKVKIIDSNIDKLIVEAEDGRIIKLGKSDCIKARRLIAISE